MVLFNKHYSGILRAMLADQLRQDFRLLLDRIKKHFGWNMPAWLNWSVLLLVQNLVLLFMAIFLEGFHDTPVFNVIGIVVLVFNFLLPSAMARQNAPRIRNHPLYPMLWTSPHPEIRLITLWCIAETMLFWLHEMLFAGMALYVIVRISPTLILGISFLIAWVLLISAIYYMTLFRNVTAAWSRTVHSGYSTNHVLFITRLLTAILVIWFITNRLLYPFFQNPLSSNAFQEGLLAGLQMLSDRFKLLLTNEWDRIADFVTPYKLPFIWAVIIIIGVWLLYSITKTVQKTPVKLPYAHKAIDIRTYGIFKLYRWAAKRWFGTDPWLLKDIAAIERGLVRSKLPALQWLLPPAVPAVSGVSVVLLSINHPINFVLCFWFIVGFTLYQTIWLWLWLCPVFHPSSELRNVELLSLAPGYTYGRFLRHKVRLLGFMLVPFFAFCSALLVFGIYWTGGNILIGLAGLAGLVLEFMIIVVLSIWWTTLSPKFDYPTVFAIRFDSYDSKIMQLLYYLPKRFITAGLLLLFVAAAFFDLQWKNYLLVDTLLVFSMIAAVCLYLYWKLGKKTLGPSARSVPE